MSEEVTIIGIDLVKGVFQLHGARNDGSVVFRKKLSQGQLLTFIAEQPHCIITMEACATARGWGRKFEKLGHEVRLISPVYVKPFVMYQKSNAANAEAIVEAALSEIFALQSSEHSVRARLCRMARACAETTFDRR